MRTFIAIELDAAIQSAMDDLIGRIRTQQADVKWNRPQAMHLTLKFLGEIDSQTVDSASSALEIIGKNHSPFSLSFRGTGTFPIHSSRPRVIWAGIESNSDLLNLHSEIESRFHDLGFSREDRTFRPHLTLGRVKSPAQLKPVLSKISELQELEIGELPVHQIFLFHSILKPEGAEYRKLKEVSFSC